MSTRVPFITYIVQPHNAAAQWKGLFTYKRSNSREPWVHPAPRVCFIIIFHPPTPQLNESVRSRTNPINLDFNRVHPVSLAIYSCLTPSTPQLNASVLFTSKHSNSQVPWVHSLSLASPRVPFIYFFTGFILLPWRHLASLLPFICFSPWLSRSSMKASFHEQTQYS